MAVANTLAYYDTTTIADVKSFIVQAPVQFLNSVGCQFFALLDQDEKGQTL
jgi:hypothetical protein